VAEKPIYRARIATHGLGVVRKNKFIGLTDYYQFHIFNISRKKTLAGVMNHPSKRFFHFLSFSLNHNIITLEF
jgi:hypothetical protein